MVRQKVLLTSASAFGKGVGRHGRIRAFLFFNYF
jgi:hypothetical protein